MVSQRDTWSIASARIRPRTIRWLRVSTISKGTDSLLFQPLCTLHPAHSVWICFIRAQTYSEKRGHNFSLNYNFQDSVKNKTQYSGLVIPGGRCTEYLSVNKDVVALTAHFTSNDLPIAAICHGMYLVSF